MVLTIYGMTIIASIIIDIVNFNNIINDAKDNDYEVDLIGLIECYNDFEADAVKKIILNTLFPFRNIFDASKRMLDYNEDKEMFIYELKTTGVANYINKEETDKPKKKSIFKNQNKIHDIKIIYNNKINVIYYQTNNAGFNIIKAVSGDISKLSIYEQNYILSSSLKKLRNEEKIVELKELKESLINENVDDNLKKEDVYCLRKKK